MVNPKGLWKKELEKRASQGARGVPLKGPFLALFSQGNLTKVSENAPFRVFCIFWLFWSLPLGF